MSSGLGEAVVKGDNELMLSLLAVDVVKALTDNVIADIGEAEVSGWKWMAVLLTAPEGCLAVRGDLSWEKE